MNDKQEYQMHADEHGTKWWRLNGELHHEGAPSVEYADGMKFWYKHGKLHREDGPAIEWPDGRKSWYIDHVRYEDISAWAEAALTYENKEPTQQMIDDKILQVMQQDLFN